MGLDPRENLWDGCVSRTDVIFCGGMTFKTSCGWEDS